MREIKDGGADNDSDRGQDMATGETGKVLQRLRGAALHDGAGLTDGQLLGCFVDRREEAAFAALVRRHGPMVWGVCRRLLDHHDAEDAFQATFLVLCRKAAFIRPRDRVANWLYGVAHRAALQARRAAARRGARERQVTRMPDAGAVEQDPWDDLRPLLDRELSRLPDKYRAVVVLCDLEGKSRKEAARDLGVPEGTVAGRLARARAMLARRLGRHGLAVSGGALAAMLTKEAASASVPASAAFSLRKAVGGLAAGRAAAGLASGRVTNLVEGVLQAMLLAKLKAPTAAVLAAILLAGTAAMASRYAAAGPIGPGEPPPRKAAEGPVPAGKPGAVSDQDESTAWGKEQGSLQAGLGYRAGQRRAYRPGETVTFVVRVRNVGDQKALVEYPRQCVVDNPPVVTDAQGGRANFTPFSKARGPAGAVERWLGPGEESDLDSLDIALRSPAEGGVSDEPTLFAGPGRYRVRLNRLAPAGSGNPLSLLATGELPLEISDPARPPGDAERVQGLWEVARVEPGGGPAGEEAEQARAVLVTGDTLTFAYPSGTRPMRYTLDPSRRPAAIDLVPAGGSDKGRTLPGIYKFDLVLGVGEQLTLCYSRDTPPGAARPTSFEAAGAERGRRYVLRRPAATRADLTGEWETPVDGVFESGWLALKPDGTFRYEMHDVALGWKTTVSGTWRLEDRSVVLQEQGRLQDGLPAEAKARQVERLCPVYQYGGWSLVGSGSKPEFRRAKKGRAETPGGK